MKISVAMCTYNGERYLQAQLDSLAAQTRLPDELIICDDASDDSSRKISQAFAASADFPVRIYPSPQNLGVKRNFERVTALCSGEIIAYSDQDDIWKPEKLERLETTFTAHPDIALLFSNAEIINENGQALNFDLWESARFSKREQALVMNGHALEVNLKHPFVYGCTMAFRSEYKASVLPFPENTDCGHDIWIVLVLSAIGKIFPLAEPLIQYRRHSSQYAGAGPPPGMVQRRLTASKRTDPQTYLDRALYIQSASDRLLTQAEADRYQRAIAQMTPYIAHLRVRGSLPRRRLARAPLVIKELLKLNYHRYASGFLSAGKDLIL